MQSSYLGLCPTTGSSVTGSALQDNFSNAYPNREDIKTSFHTREGTYRIMPLAEYSRPTRIPSAQTGSMNVTGAAVKVSFLTVYDDPQEAMNSAESAETAIEATDMTPSTSEVDDRLEEPIDRICFNIGRELYVYSYRGPQTAADLNRPIDKRVYKGTYPTCHDFNHETATKTNCNLIIGFSFGQIQLIDPFNKEYQPSRLYNEDRFVDKSAVTCIKWVPGEHLHFLVSYASGHIYLYNIDLVCPPTAPSYQMFKQGEKFAIYTCKAKSTRNPIYRWQIGSGAINQFAFSGPDAKLLATVGNDGYLRVFNYHQMELLCYMKSYFGGLLTLAWSPDAKLIATGGEDDLLTVYHLQEKRVVCRGQGHKSWISQVAFDPYASQNEPEMDLTNGLPETFDDENSEKYAPPDSNNTPVIRAHMRRQALAQTSVSRCSFASFGTLTGTSHTGVGVCYRIGSVGHDTQLCLWDITDYMLKSSNVQRHRNSTIITPSFGLEIQTSTSRLDPLCEVSPSQSVPVEKPKKKRFHRRGFTFGRIGGSTSDPRRNRTTNSSDSTPNCDSIDEARLLGTRVCPRMEDVPVIEPLICKKIAHERLTTLEFRRDCIVTACQEGFICTWARPSRTTGTLIRRELNSPSTNSPQSEAPASRSWSQNVAP